MAITFDGATKRVILDSASVTAAGIWSAWVDWHEANSQWELAFKQVGGDDLGGGLSIPPYFFLMSGWRVRPMESSHTLIVTGNLFVDGGGVPIVQTIGSYNVSAQYTVPVQAQGISTGSGLTVEQATMLADLAKLHGLITGNPLVVTATTRTAGDVSQTINDAGATTTITRV